MIRPTFHGFALVAALCAGLLAISGAKCNKGSPAAAAPAAVSYLPSLTTTDTWPHTGRALTSGPIDTCVVEPNGRGPAGYAAVAASAADWNGAAGQALFALRPDKADCGGAQVTVYLSASWVQVGNGAPEPPAGTTLTAAYTNDVLVGGVPADGAPSGGTLASATIFVYGFDPTDNVEGVVNHELPRAAGEVVGSSPNAGDVMYEKGLHGKPTASDVATLAALYMR